MHHRPYNNISYETLLRSIGSFIPATDRNPDLSTAEARAFHAMSELWQRLVVERRSLHKLKRRKRLDKPIGDLNGAISDATKYPHVAGSADALTEQANAMVRTLNNNPGLSRRELQQRVWNLAAFKNDPGRVAAFNKLWGLMENEKADRSNPV